MLGALRLLNISLNEQRLIDGPITTAEPGTLTNAVARYYARFAYQMEVV